MVKHFQFMEIFAMNVKNAQYDPILGLQCQATAAKYPTIFVQFMFGLQRFVWKELVFQQLTTVPILIMKSFGFVQKLTKVSILSNVITCK